MAERGRETTARLAVPPEGGVILYPKPPGPTSHDAVAAVRRRCPPGTKVGHAGTLDPFAEGLLLILLGRATRAQRWFVGLPKTYRAVARLGWRSTTGDPEGEIEHTGRRPQRLAIPTGRQRQVPPAYSAVKVGGRRAYQLARRGAQPALPAREITVYRAELLAHDDERAEFEIECSAGTYIRQLVADLGDAYCERLVRTRIGPFDLRDADPERVVPLGEALAFLPAVEVDDLGEWALANGRALPVRAVRGRLTESRDAIVRVLDEQGRLVAVADSRDGLLRPALVFPRLLPSS
jgi:tRNA pseudouridine55 synthase